MSASPVPYGGIATRAVALAIDAALAQGIVLGLGAVVALVASLVSEPRLGQEAKAVLAAGVWAIVVGGYFVTFWSTAGQTPGMRLLGLRVVAHDGAQLGVSRSIVRVIGLALAIVPAFLGFAPVLVDDRRRGIHDLLARTVVLYESRSLPPRPTAPGRAAAPARSGPLAPASPPPVGMTPTTARRTP